MHIVSTSTTNGCRINEAHTQTTDKSTSSDTARPQQYGGVATHKTIAMHHTTASVRSCDASLFKSGIEVYKQSLRSGLCLRVPVSSTKSRRKILLLHLILSLFFTSIKITLFHQTHSTPQKEPRHQYHSLIHPTEVASTHPQYETIAQGDLFTACTFLLQTSQPKASDFQGKKVQIMKRWACAIVSYIGV